MSTKTDHAQFELAAKAIGLPGAWSIGHNTFHIAEHLRGTSDEAVKARAKFGLANGRMWWNPRDDDGDALRLAVALNMRVGVGQVDWAGGDWVGSFSEPEEIADDPCAATRLAIFNTAVDIGEAMP